MFWKKNVPENLPNKNDGPEGKENQELLDIFPTENDKKGQDLLSMSDFLEIFSQGIRLKMNTDTTWEMKGIQGLQSFTGEIASAINMGFDISKASTLVADSSHFSKEIVEGLKNGLYHIGESKEVSGNFRPAILDDKEHLVKFFTLKRAINPTAILSDISSLSMQSSLRRISSQIEDISSDVKSLVDLSRRENLSNPFLNARDKIMSAVNAAEPERTELIKEADTYLMEGLEALYSDIDDQAKALAKQNRYLGRINTVDSILTKLIEDIQMVPQYVGLRVYLFNYRGKMADASRVFDEYEYNLKKWTEGKIENSKYTIMELIHENYQYTKENMDFWLEKPKQMLDALDAQKSILESGIKDVYYIEAEEIDDE